MQDEIKHRQIEDIQGRTGWNPETAARYVEMRQQVMEYLNSVAAGPGETLTQPFNAYVIEQQNNKTLFQQPAEMAEKFFPVHFSAMMDAGLDNIAGWRGVSRTQIIAMGSMLLYAPPPDFYVSHLTPDNFYDVTSHGKPIKLSHALGVFSVAAGIDDKRIGDVQSDLEKFLTQQNSEEICGVSLQLIKEKMKAHPDMTVNEFIFDVIQEVEGNCAAPAEAPNPEKSRLHL